MPTQPTFSALFARLRGTLEGTLLTSRVDANRFDILLGAATAKSIDFNIRAHDAAASDGILLQPFLRPLVEELIYLVYLKSLAGSEQTALADALQLRDVHRSIRQQQAFFDKHRPGQPIFLAEFFGAKPDEHERDANDTLKKTWRRLGWPERGPTVRDLAGRVDLLELYDFLYAATSRVVHFTPHALMRLGWASVSGDDPSSLRGTEHFTFSLDHFARYHCEFTRFYATFLYFFQYEAFKEHYPSDRGVDDTVSEIRTKVSEIERWPEVVTFEEMNMQLADGAKHFLRVKHPLGAALMGLMGTKRDNGASASSREDSDSIDESE